jgi:hypothetical protein
MSEAIYTWAQFRDVIQNAGVTPIPTDQGANNRVYGAGTKYLKTIEGNGFLRRRPFGGAFECRFFENTNLPPTLPDTFIAGVFVDPYPVQMLGYTVTTSSSSFTIIADAFTVGQDAGTGGTEPFTSISNFQDVS